jgi:hypothetical protein
MTSSSFLLMTSSNRHVITNFGLSSNGITSTRNFINFRQPFSNYFMRAHGKVVKRLDLVKLG